MSEMKSVSYIAAQFSEHSLFFLVLPPSLCLSLSRHGESKKAALKH